MKFIKQPMKLDILGFKEDEERKTFRHSPLLPNSIRALIIGPSGCGKTCVLMSLLLHKNGLKYKNIYLYSKSLEQPKYKYLEKIIDGVKEINFFAFDNNEDIVSIEDAEPDSVMIFDDILLEKQDVARQYFARSRHKNIDCLYLGQSYSKIPKYCVRDCTNFLIIFEQDYVNLMNIYRSHVHGTLDFSKFHEMCKNCWREKYSFLVIDKTKTIEKGRFRKNFDLFIIP